LPQHAAEIREEVGRVFALKSVEEGVNHQLESVRGYTREIRTYHLLNIRQHPISLLDKDAT
jgi:hypothetical protein